MDANVRKAVLSTFFLFLYFSLIVGNPVLAKNEMNRATGLRESTAKDKEYIKKHWLEIKKVKPNRIGLERINRNREKKGLPALDAESFAPLGQEVIGESSDSSINEDLYATAGALPPYVDNSFLPAFPPIRTQGSLPSCVPFSINYYQLTHNTALVMGWDNKNSDNTTKFSPKWSYNMINGGAMGNTSFSSAYRILEKHGCATWADFPYDSNYREWSLNPAVWRDAIYYRTNTVQYVSSVSSESGLKQLKELLNNGYVVIFGTYVYSWQYKTIGNDPSTVEDDSLVGKSICYWMNGAEGGHSMTFVGYNDHLWVDINNNGIVDEGEKGALRVANSWGTGWKEGGFTWLAYDALRSNSTVSGAPTSDRRGAVISDRAYHLTIKENYEPKVLAEFTLNHLKRNQVRINLGISDTNQTVPATTWYPDAIYFDGGPYAFNGTTTAIEGTFIFDFTDIIPTHNDQRWYVGMYDSTAGDMVTLTSFRLIDSWHGDIITESYDVPQTADGGDQIHVWADYEFSDGNLPPYAEFFATPTVGDISLTVEFDGSSSYDSDGSIVRFDWDFGDGGIGSGDLISHTYTTAGEFTATLTVTDNGSRTDMATVRVTVDDPNNINAPTNLVAEAAAGSVTLRWTDQSNNEQGFKIERAEKIRGKYKFSLIDDSINADVSTYSDPVGSGTYKYRVQAYNGSTVSDYSNEVLVQVEQELPPDSGVLNPPSDLNTSFDGTNVTLTWNDSNSDSQGFYIERGIRITGKFQYMRIGSAAADNMIFRDNNVSSGTYYYRVQTYGANGTSDYSNAISVRIK